MVDERAHKGVATLLSALQAGNFSKKFAVKLKNSKK